MELWQIADGSLTFVPVTLSVLQTLKTCFFLICTAVQIDLHEEARLNSGLLTAGAEYFGTPNTKGAQTLSFHTTDLGSCLCCFGGGSDNLCKWVALRCYKLFTHHILHTPK